ncbi:MAG TPA: hemerythrin domain-containing protein [Roseiflexaceae bacterium]|nr:hemerythrin domain-containing protein [Roseiflexaceae bacterium]
MSSIMQPLREEHQELLPQIERLRTVADLVGDASAETVRHAVDEIYAFLTRHLIPHALAEDAALYPIVGKVMGAVQATATMSRDHVEVGRLTDELATLRLEAATGYPDERQAKALRRVLYGLYALIKVHFAKEEEIYLPLLETRLTGDEARELFAAMEHAAHEVKVQLAREA